MPFSGICSYFLYVQKISILFKMTFSGMSSPQIFFCSVIVLLMSAYKTNLSDISLLHSSLEDVFPSKYSFHSGWCFYQHSGLGMRKDILPLQGFSSASRWRGSLTFCGRQCPRSSTAAVTCVILPSCTCI